MSRSISEDFVNMTPGVFVSSHMLILPERFDRCIRFRHHLPLDQLRQLRYRLAVVRKLRDTTK